jgi:hypothetical protein
LTFSDVFRKFSSVVQLLLPIAATFVPGAGLPILAIKIIGKLPSLMATADELFTEAGQGALKKEFVMNAAQVIATTVSDCSTGGQKETWEKQIAPNISQFIDTAVAIANTVQPGVIDDSEQTAAQKAGVMG